MNLSDFKFLCFLGRIGLGAKAVVTRIRESSYRRIYAHTLSRPSTTHTLAAVDPALALPTGDLAEAPQAGTGLEPLCCVCGDMWGTLSPPYSCESLDCVEGGDV